jgi:hypothetical protein
MSPYESLVMPFAEYVAPALLVASLLLAALIMRNPNSPRWLRSEPSAQAVAFLFTAAFGFGFATDLAKLLGGHASDWFSVATTLAVMVITGALIWFAFDFTGRLRNADAGISPFHRPKRKSNGTTPLPPDSALQH